MTDNWRSRVREILLAESKHQDRPGHSCARCGATGKGLANSIAIFVEGNPGYPPTTWLALPTSYAPNRGALLICTDCAPPCKKCQQPVIAGKTKKWLVALPKVFIARGYCREHAHILGFTF